MTDKIMMDGEPLELGNEVYCLLNGKGKVANINKKVTLSIEVAFSDGYCSYTNTFKGWTNHENRTLYWRKPEIIPPPKPKKKEKVWDWFIQKSGSGLCQKITQKTYQEVRVNHYDAVIIQKIDGTEREVER